MKLLHYLKRLSWRMVLLLVVIASVIGPVYVMWSPGKRVSDGRHDLRSNGIWIQHGWLGDNQWFARNKRDTSHFRDPSSIQNLADVLANHGVKYVFPHLCPCNPQGGIAPVDPQQTERFLNHFQGFEVLPWVGGVLNVHCFTESPKWRSNFVASVVDLLQSHPRLAGIHINIEPMPSGNNDFLILLGELRQAVPDSTILSVAAFPPPTLWHPFSNVHWGESYFRQVSERVDQLAVMMYDTSIKWPKLYQRLMSGWTSDVLAWGEDSKVLLGIPVYDDSGVGYHFPEVENLQNALLGIHAGLASFEELPTSYSGVAIYCEWEMDDQEWQLLKTGFASQEVFK